MDLMWKQGISEADLCNAAGINKSAVTDWKKGKTKSYLKHIDKISEVLGVTKQYLLEDNNEKTAPAEQSFSKDELEFLHLIETLTEDEKQKVIDYADLLKRGRTQ